MIQSTLKLLLTMLIFTFISQADEHRHKPVKMTPGMKVFKQKMRKGCRSTAIRFSRTHTQKQWKFIKEKGLLRREAKHLCPNLDTSLLSDKEWNSIYKFVTEHSRDNPEILKC